MQTEPQAQQEMVKYVGSTKVYVSFEMRWKSSMEIFFTSVRDCLLTNWELRSLKN